MRILPTLALALRRLAQRPFRSFLLLQGTVWGVAVAVFPTAVIQGTRQAAMVRGEALGADRVTVAADPTAQQASGLRQADVDALAASLERAGIEIKALGAARVLAVYEDGAAPGALVGATPEAPLARGLALARGRLLRADDDPATCVVEAGVAGWLGRDALVLPATITLPDGRGPLRVVGVLEPQGPILRRTNDLGFDVEHPLYERLGRQLLFALGIPFVEDAWKRADRVVYVPPREDDVDWIFLRTPTRQVKEAARIASSTLVDRGRAPVAFHPLVLPLVMGGKIDRFDAVQYALFLACLAMGAVVMANVGLLAVLRRRSEIAIRRVEGATQRDIALHFLLEALLLTAVGAVLGSVLGMGLAALRVSFEPVTGFTWSFPWREGLLAVAVALVVGLLAALLPALRAARQDPVTGLADE